MKVSGVNFGTALLLAWASGSSAAAESVSYDYIVAGGGTAGIVAAEQLSQSGLKVLLLERGPVGFHVNGGRNSPAWNSTVSIYDVPGLGDYLSNYEGVPRCTDLSSGVPAGCALGGGTLINAMVFVRPRAADFASWPEAWHWDKANGVSQAAEELYSTLPGSILPSTDGKRYDDESFGVVARFLRANGFRETDALHKPEAKSLVYSHPPWSIAKNGQRDSPAKAILSSALARPGFSLQTGTKVLRAVRTGRKVTGVEVERADGSREIISLSSTGSLVLAAGTHSTPRLLFNSGIGPAAQIETVASGSTNITLPSKEQWVELPVGENLKDHAVATITLSTNPEQPLTVLPSTAWTVPSLETIDMFARGAGLMSQASQRLNFWTNVNTTSSPAKEYFIQGTVRASANNTITIKLYLTHGTTSTGVVSIDAKGNTLATNPRLQSQEDIEAMTVGINTVLGWARQPNSILTVAENVTAEALIPKAASGAHYMGTTQMGTSNNGKSVVDVNTKVWGFENLFVVDGSFHPEVPTGNAQAPIMVAAKYAAKRILALHGRGNC